MVDGTDAEKQTNEIKVAAPLLDPIDIKDKVITADALLTQREFARYLVEDRGADYHFTVKGNQKQLLEDIRFHLEHTHRSPDASQSTAGEHGRIETRQIWVSSCLNDYLDFPYVGQVFKIERRVFHKKHQKETCEVIYGITSQTAQQACAKQVLETNRGHWCIENQCHYIIDWNYDEDRSGIRSGYGAENMTRLRRFCVGLMKSKGVNNVAQTMRKLILNIRSVFDYLKMTNSSYAISTTYGRE